MAYKILLWNTQHFNNQKSTQSEAYQQKAALIGKIVTARPQDLIALFEVGTTGNVNKSAVETMGGFGYELVSSLGQEGGSRADTTLGCMVFVSKARAHEFVMLAWEYVLGGNERRAPVVVVHKANGNAFGFYHANASYNAQVNVTEAIRFLIQHKGKSFGELVFFGGDLNFIADAKNVITADNHKELKPSIPPVAGTHIRIYSKTGKDISEAYRNEVEDMGGLEQTLSDFGQAYRWGEAITEENYHYTPSILDYAYVTETCKWYPQCDGTVAMRGNQDGGYSEIRRMYLGDQVRSDHFPVLYLGQEKNEALAFSITLDQAVPVEALNRVEFYFGKFRVSPSERDMQAIAAQCDGANGNRLDVRCAVNLYSRYQSARSQSIAYPLMVVLNNPNPGEIGMFTRVFYATAVAIR